MKNLQTLVIYALVPYWGISALYVLIDEHIVNGWKPKRLFIIIPMIAIWQNTWCMLPLCIAMML